jgi:amidase
VLVHVFAAHATIAQDNSDSHGSPVAPEGASLPRALDFAPFEAAMDAMTPERLAEIEALVFEQPIAAIQNAMQHGKLTARELVLYYLHRIRAYDDALLNAIIELNAQALEMATLRDLDLGRGMLHGPLHGIPVLLKDNIATGDFMHTTAGAAALVDTRANTDAFLVAQLREAGAVILGKTNLSEWANWMHSSWVDGFSAVGGQTYSPYGYGNEVGGSSTGSAVAVSANFAPLSIGTETIGSIISPASRNSIVGMHPSLGLISRDMIIPLTDYLDTAGPMGRTVADVALAMTVFAASQDESDSMAWEAEPLIGTDFTKALRSDALARKRIGIWGTDPDLSDLDNIWMSGLGPDVEVLEAAGTEVVVVFPDEFGFLDWEPSFNCGLRDGSEAFLEQSNSSFTSLAEIVEFNYSDQWTFMPYGQDRLEEALWCEWSPEDLEWVAAANRENARAYIDALMEQYELDAIATVDESSSIIYSLAGAPAITVPRGSWGEGGQPTGITFVGSYLTDFELISYAYAYEQASQMRLVPDLGHLAATDQS